MMRRSRVRRGRVERFDEAAGHGTVRTGDGAAVWFHCTAVADGSRAIGVGEEVELIVGPGRGGAWDAVRVWRAGQPSG